MILCAVLKMSTVTFPHSAEAKSSDIVVPKLSGAARRLQSGRETSCQTVARSVESTVNMCVTHVRSKWPGA